MLLQHLKQNKNEHLANGVLIFLVGIIFGLSFFTVNSARGTDQFWYLSDTETLVNGSDNHSNLTMPGVVLRQNQGSPATPFYHNGPLLYLNAYISKITGLDAFTIWKINNILFSLLAALMTSLLVAEVSNRNFHLYSLSLFLLSPLNVWLSVNLLQETFYAFLFSIQVYIATRCRESRILFPILLFSLLFGAYSHPFFKLMTLATCGIYFLHNHYYKSLAILAIFMTVLLTKEQFFPTSFPPDLQSLIAYSIPGQSNSLWHQSDQILSVTPELLFQKFNSAIEAQLNDIKVPLLSLITYLSIPAFLVLVYNKKIESTTFLWIYFIAFGLYSGIVLLLQFQVRYQQIIAPASVAVVSIALVTFFEKNSKTIAIAILLSFFAIDLKLVSTASTDGLKFSQSSQKFQDFVRRFPKDYRVAFINDKQLGRYSHLVRSSKPRQTMVIGTNWLSDEGFKKAIELFKPNLLIYSESSLNFISTEEKSPSELSTFHKVGKLYYLDLGKEI